MRVPEVISAVTTPFNQDGSVDVNGFRTQCERLAQHLDGVFVAGTTGEFPSLAPAEHAWLVGTALEVWGAYRTVVHVGSASTRQSVELLLEAKAAGARRFAALTPYYFHASVEATFRHWSALAEIADGEVYGYVFPDVAGSDLPPEALRRVNESGIAGIKLSGTAAARVEEYLAYAPSGFRVWSGNDADLPALMVAGATGVVSGVSGVCPGPWEAYVQACREHDDARASAAQAVISKIVPRLGPSVSYLKHGLDIQGLSGGPCRMSIDPPTSAIQQEIADAVRLGTANKVTQRREL